MNTSSSPQFASILVIGMALAPSPALRAADADTAAAKPVVRESPQTPRKPDLSGRMRVGKASLYAKQFEGRKMADGTPMDPNDDNAASKTLPLGTKAKVTNLETGKSAVVTIQDRGPYVKGRIVDVSARDCAPDRPDAQGRRCRRRGHPDRGADARRQRQARRRGAGAGQRRLVRLPAFRQLSGGGAAARSLVRPIRRRRSSAGSAGFVVR